jgi:hypothetical protein
MDLGEGFIKKSSDRCAIFLFSFQSTFESKQDYPSLRFGWTLERALLRKAQTAARSSFFHFNPLLKVNFQRYLKRKKPVEFDWLFLVAGTGLEPVAFGL